jgi:non-specific serine/threonine protein kinase/serine/threonine-protein kinase
MEPSRPEDGYEQSTRTRDGPPAALRLPERIGRYHVKRVIASGGMGTVYEATQESPRRVVALKVMKQGIASRSALRRFEYEGQILARLRHPGIAQIFEAGMHVDKEGLLGPAGATAPYFAMEYIPNAKPITRYVEDKKLGTRERLQLFAQVCDAVHHGHQKGIIHRDLKPSNILVTSDPTAAPRAKGGQGGLGQVKIIDFGVARSTDSDLAVTTLQTDVGQLIGTLQYMSPEQCEADPHDIDIRSDVYALGVVFYELLCGKLPYDLTGVPMHHATRVIREQDPTKLSTRDRALRGDVETIALKALEKDRTRRYQSAAEFAQDIERYLSNRPILARPPSAVYQLRVFARRNRALCTAAAVVFLALASASVISTSMYLRAESARLEQSRERERAEREAQRARLAESQAAQRTADLEKVSRFQASQFSGMDPERFGASLRRRVLEKRRGVLSEAGSDQEAIEKSLGELESALIGVNFTDVGVETLDENIFERALAAIEKDFADQPLVKAQLLLTIGGTLREIGLFDNATAPLTEALDIRRRDLGNDHPDTLNSITGLGDLLYEQRRLNDALPYFRQALDGRRRALGHDHPDTLESLDSVGLTFLILEEYSEAEMYLREALQGRRDALGDNHRDTLESIANLGFLFWHQSKFSEAEPYYREALEGRRRVLGDDHPDTISSVFDLALVFWKQGKFSEAEPGFRQRLERRVRVLGEDHMNTIAAHADLGLLHLDQGRYVNPARLSDAEACCSRALQGARRLAGDDHWVTLTIVDWLGAALLEQGKVSAAEPHVRHALEGRRRMKGDDVAWDAKKRTIAALSLLGSVLADKSQLFEAEQAFRQVVEGNRGLYGDDHPSTLNSFDSLGEVLLAQGKLSEAEPYVVESFEARRLAGYEHPRSLDSIRNLGVLRREQGRSVEAEALGAEPVQRGRVLLGDHVWRRGAILFEYGRTLLTMDRFAGAEPYLLESAAILTNSLGSAHRRTINATQALAELYESWDAAEPGKGYDAKAAEWRARLEEAGSEATRQEGEKPRGHER